MIPRFDPEAPRGAIYRGAVAFVRTRPGRWLAMNLAARWDPKVLKATRGRLSTYPMARSVLLEVRGRRTGEPREIALLYFTQGDDVILIASSFGRDRHPAWYLNLKANPDVRLTSRGRSGRYLAEEVEDDAERRRLLDLARGIYPGYEDYEQRTTRRIPVLRLRPA